MFIHWTSIKLKKILHNAEYALSILNVVDFCSEKLVLKLFEPFSDHFLARKSQNCPKRHYVDFSLGSFSESCSFWHCFERSLSSPCTRLMKKLSLTFKLVTCLRDIDLHGQLGANGWRLKNCIKYPLCKGYQIERLLLLYIPLPC